MTPSDDPYDPMPADDDFEEPEVDRKMIRQFREQTRSLGLVWIIFGGLNLAIAALAFTGNAQIRKLAGGQEVVFVFAGVFGSIWIICGILSLVKILPAIFVGLGLTYIAIALNVITLNICGIVIDIVIILQAHRVIRWASKMRQAGVPLDTKLPPKREY